MSQEFETSVNETPGENGTLTQNDDNAHTVEAGDGASGDNGGQVSEVSGMNSATPADDGTVGEATSDIATGTGSGPDAQTDRARSLAEQAMGGDHTDGPRLTGHDEA